MEKRAYSKPTISRVKLNVEQAVLSQCSGLTTNVSTSSPVFCDDRCRQNNKSRRPRRGRGGTDFEGSS